MLFFILFYSTSANKTCGRYNAEGQDYPRKSNRFGFCTALAPSCLAHTTVAQELLHNLRRRQYFSLGHCGLRSPRRGGTGEDPG